MYQSGGMENDLAGLTASEFNAECGLLEIAFGNVEFHTVFPNLAFGVEFIQGKFLVAAFHFPVLRIQRGGW